MGFPNRQHHHEFVKWIAKFVSVWKCSMHSLIHNSLSIHYTMSLGLELDVEGGNLVTPIALAHSVLLYRTTHHFVTEMCTPVHISVTIWWIMGYLSNALWDLWDEYYKSHASDKSYRNFVSFLAATKHLYEWFSPSVRLSVRPPHLFHHVPIIVSSWNFQKLSPMTKVMSTQKVKVRGQRSRSQRSQPNLTVSGL